MPRSLIRRLLTTVADHAAEETASRIGDRLEEEGERRPGLGLDATMGFMLALVVAGWFGLYEGTTHLPAAAPWALATTSLFLIGRAIGFLIISGICIGLVCALMSQVQSVGTKLAIYFGVAIFIAGVHFLSGLREDRSDRKAQTQSETAQRTRRKRGNANKTKPPNARRGGSFGGRGDRSASPW